MSGKEWVAEQRVQQQRLNLTAGSPLAVAIVVFSTLGIDPGIQQDVTRATVEAGDRLVALDQAQVAETADIEDRALAAALIKERFMKGRY